MFSHNLKYSLKTLFRNKSLIFWTFAFPIILGTFFKMAFANIENNEKLNIINIAIINNNDFNKNKIFNTVFEDLSCEDNENRLFEINYVDEQKAKDLLKNEEIIGYLKLENDQPKLTFKTNGINETIFKFVVEEIMQKNKIINNLIEDTITKNYNFKYENIYNEAIKLTNENSVNLKNISSDNLSYTLIEFYTLIAMACLYGGLLGAVAINKNLANMSNEGKRISIAPVKKWKIILSSVLSCYIIEVIGIMLLFIYTIGILNVNYGSNLLLIIALALIGIFAGISLGVFIASTTKASENAKTGIIITITMIGCFLSGMMGITMKYLVDKNIPFINKINPVSMITDGFYSLYYYDTLNRYIFDITSLLIFSFILILLSYFCLRRQKYDHI